MPLDQPNQDLAYRTGAEATMDVLKLLRERYGIAKPVPLPDCVIHQRLLNQWNGLEKELLKIIQEMAWVHTCACF